MEKDNNLKDNNQKNNNKNFDKDDEELMSNNSKVWGLCEAFEYDLKHAPKSYIALGHPKDKAKI